MKTYKVKYTETLIHIFYVEAESLEEAAVEFEKEARSGDIDFSGGEVDNTETEITEVSE